MSKKLIIITAAAGLLGFIGSLMFAWFTKPAVQPRPTDTKQTTAIAQNAGTDFTQSRSSETSAKLTGPALTRSLTEKHLKNLIYDVREKIDEYKEQLEALKLREQRMTITQETLKKDIEQLSELRIETASMVAALKQQRQNLLETRVEITKNEKANLVSIAATYDKMNPVSAGQIFAKMSQMQTSDSAGIDDVVKIMRYMNDRNKAKVLAELVAFEPKLASVLSQRLKKTVEIEQ